MADRASAFRMSEFALFSDRRERIACENRLIALDADLDHLVQEFFAASNLLQDECEEVAAMPERLEAR